MNIRESLEFNDSFAGGDDPALSAESGGLENQYFLGDLEEPIDMILHQLHEKINNGEYKYIIGDDASGRMPALIFWNFMKKVCKQKGLDSPKLYFIAGSGPSREPEEQAAKKEKLKKYLEPLKDMKDGRILIVTDTIVSGASIRPLVDTIREYGVECDVAAIGVSGSLDELENKFGVSIYVSTCGDRDNITPKVYKQNHLSGVFKHPDDVFAYPLEEEEKKKGAIGSARRDAKTIADRLFEKYEPNL